MVFLALISGIIIGSIKNGKIERIGYIKFEHVKLLFIAVGLRVTVFILNIGLFDISIRYYDKLVLMSYFFVIIFLIININLQYIYLILAGVLSNTVFYVINGFKTGITLSAAKSTYEGEILDLLIKGNLKLFTIISDKNYYYGNFFSLKKIINYPLVFSFGDIAVFIGIVLIVQTLMIDKRLRKGKKIRFSKKIRF